MFGLNNKQIKFSLIMPTYNRGFCIREAVDSVLEQTYQNFELIIIDDGSEDETEKLIEETYADELKSGKIIYCRIPHAGVSHARNIGLRMAGFEWIGYVDSDNKIVPNYLETFVNAMKKTKANSYYCCVKTREGSIVIGRRFKYKRLKESNYIDMGAFVHSVKLYKKYGGFDENLKRFVDWDLVLTYTKHNKPYFINEILVDYNNSKGHKRISTTQSDKEHYDAVRFKHGFIKEIAA